MNKHHQASPTDSQHHPHWHPTMEKSQSEDYLRSLLNKTLRVTTSDSRMFLGQFKCTDSVNYAFSNLPPSLNSRLRTTLTSQLGPEYNPRLNLRVPNPSSAQEPLWQRACDFAHDESISGLGGCARRIYHQD